MQLTELDRARFWSQVEVTTAGGRCWLWTGATKDGYGRYTTQARKTEYAHRIAYTLLVGPIPVGLTLDHLCRTRNCVNPKHLDVCSTGENVLRGEGSAASRKNQTECMRGHPFNEKNTRRTKQGWRQCRICEADRARQKYQRRRGKK